MLLAVSALALSLLFGANNPVSAPSPASTVPPLPPTQPGLSRDEGVFLVTTADDGSQLIYFIAGNTRHNVTPGDVSLELQQNPLWPIRQAAKDYVGWFAEGAPIGAAQLGQLNGNTARPADAAPESAEAAQPLADAAPEPAAASVAANPADAAAAADDTASPVATYTVAPGDSAFKIARRFGVDEEALLEANNIGNANRVYVGQVLTIPATSS